MTKVRGPSVGSAVVLQGRHVKHVALRSYNAPEVTPPSESSTCSIADARSLR